MALDIPDQLKEVATENYALLAADKNGGTPTLASTAGFPAFRKAFKCIIDDETVPENIPWAVPYEELEKKKASVPAKVKKVRGKLNVPRERFHICGKTAYLWAGLQFQE